MAPSDLPPPTHSHRPPNPCETNRSQRERSLSHLVRLFNFLGLDRAIFYSILLRAWQFIAAIGTIVVLSFYTSPDTQGYYYTFTSLIALQAFFELGLHSAVANHVGHEWARLSLSPTREIQGDSVALQRLSEIYRFTTNWYLIIGGLFVFGVGYTGFYIFERTPTEIAWRAPWFCLVIASGALIWTNALSSFLEASNQYAEVGRVRLLQALCGNIAVWLCFIADLGLWAVVTANLVRLLGDGWLIGVRYRAYFGSLNTSDASGEFSWRQEIVPLQWRLAVRSIVGFFLTGMFVPVLFEHHGPAEAGRMGLTWSALTSIDQAAHAWISTRGAQFCEFAATKNHTAFDQLFTRAMRISSAVLTTAILCLVAVISLFETSGYDLASRFAERVLPWHVTLLFGVGVVFTHLLRGISVYMLSYKVDPFLKASLLTPLMVAILVLTIGKGGALAIALCYTGVLAIYSLPMTVFLWREWIKSRTREGS